MVSTIEELDEMRARAVSEMYGKWSWVNPELQSGFFNIVRAIREADELAGLVTVPLTPTEEMLSAGEGTYWHCGGMYEPVAMGENQYDKMISASPFAKKEG